MSIEVFRQIRVRAKFDPVVRRQLASHPLRFLEAYDLTEDEKRHIVLPQFSWILQNRLAAMPYPPTEDAYVVLQRVGIKCILNLSEYLDDLPDAFGFHTVHVPIPDLAAPTLEQVRQAVTTVRTALERDMPVAVHCVAGLGRTGTILACYFVGTGVSAYAAINSIRQLRPGSIETAEQEAIVYEYEHLLTT